MITEAHLALQGYDPKIAKPSTLIYKYCKNRLTKLLRNEKRYYRMHRPYLQGGDTSLTQSELRRLCVKQPCDNLLLEEALEKLRLSGLSPRTEEVVSMKLRNPEKSDEEIGEILGMTKQGISLHIISAKNYFSNNKLDISI